MGDGQTGRGVAKEYQKGSGVKKCIVSLETQVEIYTLVVQSWKSDTEQCMKLSLFSNNLSPTLSDIRDKALQDMFQLIALIHQRNNNFNI